MGRNGASSAETRREQAEPTVDKTFKLTWMAEHRGEVLEETVESELTNPASLLWDFYV